MKHILKTFFCAGSRLNLVAKNTELEDRVMYAENMSQIFQNLYNSAVERETLFSKQSEEFKNLYQDNRRELEVLRVLTAEQDRLIDILRKQIEALSK
jgi:hypothetical protein